MEPITITGGDLYIKRIVGVISSYNKLHHRLLHAGARHSDGFILVTEGSCTYSFEGGKTVTVKAGQIIYLPYLSSYTMYIHEPCYRYIYCDFFFDSDSPRHPAVFLTDNPSHTENLFVRLRSAYVGGSRDRLPEAMSILYSIYSAAVRSCKDGEVLRYAVAEQAKRYIDLHFSEPSLGVSALAEEAGVSEVYLRRMFKQRYGQTPSEHIVSVRLAHARALMSDPVLSLEECALQSGFSSLQYFCRVFKARLGITPAAYRRKK